MMDKKHITGIILSGGKSSRMGNDKGFLLYDGKPFVQHSIEVLMPLVSRIMIVSNSEDYDIFGLERIEDVIENAGPLAGIYSGLKQSSTAYNLVLSCDIPLIKTDILKKLIEAIDDEAEVIQIESQHRNMPLIALYKKTCEHIFLDLLNAGERRLQFAVNQCKVKNVVLDNEEACFTKNINTPEQLNDILK
ncbi:molybdenum cofactor guanylyltransferase [Mariniflexile sp. HNIBRBA6329]|uniref:molybdenum cofactor guanylyltransferase n=1 Tax=Mariniflexile sp. HNIBRBA6329 TaxID=3373088 RepID=UPI003747435E